MSIEANRKYYQEGIFPPESVVPLETMPPLVTSETIDEQENPSSPPAASPVDWSAFPGVSR